MDRPYLAVALVAGLLIGSGATYVLVGPSLGRTTTVTSAVTVTTTLRSTLTLTTTSSSSATATDSTTTVDGQAIASTTNSTLGLEITLTLNATQMTVGQKMDAYLSWHNVLPRALNLSSYTQDWGLIALANDGDGYGYCPGRFPFMIEILGGNLTPSNVTQGVPVDFFGNAVQSAAESCNLATSGWQVFPALASGGGWADVTNGSNINGALSPFEPHAYTVVGGDRWGQMVILHFVVTQANP